MRKLGVEVLYYGGYGHEAGLIIRQAKEHGYPLQLVRAMGSAIRILAWSPAQRRTARS
jgi:ABC-type branched-subunit amino acid transport system substrate-binding protein